jgi:hypothetical protein
MMLIGAFRASSIRSARGRRDKGPINLARWFATVVYLFVVEIRVTSLMFSALKTNRAFGPPYLIVFAALEQRLTRLLSICFASRHARQVQRERASRG